MSASATLPSSNVAPVSSPPASVARRSCAQLLSPAHLRRRATPPALAPSVLAASAVGEPVLWSAGVRVGSVSNMGPWILAGGSVPSATSGDNGSPPIDVFGCFLGRGVAQSSLRYVYCSIEPS